MKVTIISELSKEIDHYRTIKRISKLKFEHKYNFTLNTSVTYQPITEK